MNTERKTLPREDEVERLCDTVATKDLLVLLQDASKAVVDFAYSPAELTYQADDRMTRLAEVSLALVRQATPRQNPKSKYQPSLKGNKVLGVLLNHEMAREDHVLKNGIETSEAIPMARKLFAVLQTDEKNLKRLKSGFDAVKTHLNPIEELVKDASLRKKAKITGKMSQQLQILCPQQMMQSFLAERNLQRAK